MSDHKTAKQNGFPAEQFVGSILRGGFVYLGEFYYHEPQPMKVLAKNYKKV